jgi:CheY-like chemotaxis protein
MGPVPKILAIYNEQENLTGLAAFLKNVMPDCAVTTAQSGIEGIEKAKAGFPDTILLDMEIPESEGFEIIKRLKSEENTRDIPIILAGGTTDPKTHAKGLELGANSFLDKSIDENVLVAQINASLRMKKAEDHLRQEKEKLEALLRRTQKSEAISALTGGIAHDFNNILTAILGYTEIAMGRSQQETPIYTNLEEVLKAGYRARDLVKQLLNFSRQTDQDKKPLQVSLVIKEALKMLRAALPTTIEIRQDIKTGSGKVMADPTQIHQMLVNLCINAARSMQEKGGRLEVILSDIELDSRFTDQHKGLTPGPYIKITVSDTGHGISPSTIQKIFDPDFASKGGEKGSDIGLTVVQGIVKNHGGTLTVYSEHNRGTTFNIFFPRIAEEGSQDIPLATSLPKGTERVLFVDDEHVLADLGEHMLKPLGYTVTTQTSSIEALELFRAQPQGFDLVVTDMTMPDMTGLELAGKLLQIRADLPIILCSGFSEMVTHDKAMATGIREFITKPIELVKMAKIVRRVLDRKAPHGETK